MEASMQFADGSVVLDKITTVDTVTSLAPDGPTFRLAGIENGVAYYVEVVDE